MSCSGSPGDIELANTQLNNLVLDLKSSGSATLGPISETSGAAYTTSVFNAISGNQGYMAPGDEQEVDYGVGSGSERVFAAPEDQQKSWATVSLIGNYLPVDVLGDASALKSAVRGFTTDNGDYFSCLGAKPSNLKKVYCAAKLAANVTITAGKLALAAGIQIIGTVKKAIGAALALVNVAAFVNNVVQQYLTLTKADRTMTINAGSVTVGPKNKVLIMGDGDADEDPGYTSFSNLSAALDEIGLTVSTLPGTTALPDNFGSYGQIWVDGITDLSTQDEQSLEAFIMDGGGVYINGDWGGVGQFSDQSVQDILQADVSSSISVTDDADDAGPLSVNPDAIDDIATTPNTLTTWTPSAVGGISGVAPANTLFTNDYGDAAGGVWDVGSSGGRLAVLMDVNWAQSSYEDPSTAPLVAQNIGDFLSN